MGTKVPGLEDLIGKVLRLPFLATDENWAPIEQKEGSIVEVEGVSVGDAIGCRWLNQPAGFWTGDFIVLDLDIFLSGCFEILAEEEVEALGFVPA